MRAFENKVLKRIYGPRRKREREREISKRLGQITQ
jgi:hypothetical protein